MTTRNSLISHTISNEEPTETPDERQKRFLLEVDAKHAYANDKDDATKRFQYLLGLSAIFRKFIDLNA